MQNFVSIRATVDGKLVGFWLKPENTWGWDKVGDMATILHNLRELGLDVKLQGDTAMGARHYIYWNTVETYDGRIRLQLAD